MAENEEGSIVAGELATAGAYLKESSFSFSKYLQQYEAQWEAVASIEGLADYPTRILYTTWDISFTRIRQQNIQAAHLLNLSDRSASTSGLC
jgi:hypothetical protein